MSEAPVNQPTVQKIRFSDLKTRDREIFVIRAFMAAGQPYSEGDPSEMDVVFQINGRDVDLTKFFDSFTVAFDTMSEEDMDRKVREVLPDLDSVQQHIEDLAAQLRSAVRWLEQKEKRRLKSAKSKA